MKNILILVGMGLNERGWARLFSNFGRVTMIQMGFVEHVEIWEKGHRIHCGPESSTVHYRRFDEALLGAITALRILREVPRLFADQRIDLVVAAAYIPVAAALILRRRGQADKVVSFLTDYLPPQGSLFKKLHRRLTQWLVEWGTRRADQAWTLSPRIKAAEVNPRNFVVPMWISHEPAPPGPREDIAYIGFPSEDHALEILFEVCARHRFHLNIIGDSPYLQSIRHLAPPDTRFHGILNDEARIHEILSRCFCGYAIYRNTGPTSYSYYGFPSKALYCLASNVPIVITDVAHFNRNFEKFGVGRVVEPHPRQIEDAILQFKEHYVSYSQAIDRFREEWNAGVERFHRERLAELWGGCL